VRFKTKDFCTKYHENAHSTKMSTTQYYCTMYTYNTPVGLV